MRGHGAAGLAGGARLDVGQSALLRDEDGDQESEQDSAGSEQEGGAGNERLLRTQREKPSSLRPHSVSEVLTGPGHVTDRSRPAPAGQRPTAASCDLTFKTWRHTRTSVCVCVCVCVYMCVC